MLEDQCGDIWIGTQKGLSRYNGSGFETYKLGGNSTLAVFSLLEDRDGNIWVGTVKGVFKAGYKKSTSITDSSKSVDFSFTPFSLENRLPTTRTNVLYQSKSGTIWIGHEKGLIEIDAGKAIRYDASNNWENYNVSALLEDQSGKLWIGTYEHGAFSFDNSNFESLSELVSLSSDNISCLFLDATNQLWIGTTDQGVIQWNRNENSFSYLTEVDGLQKDDVRSIIADRWQNIWIATSGGGISKYAGRQFRHFNTQNNLREREVYSLAQDRQGTIWFGTERGISRYYNGDFQHFAKAEGFLNARTRAIFVDRDDRVWMGTDGQGLARLDSSGFVFFTTESGLASNWINSIQQDTSGILLAGY